MPAYWLTYVPLEALAEKLGNRALAPLFVFLLLAYVAKHFLSLLTQLNRYRSERAENAARAISASSRTLAGLDRTVINEEEFQKIKQGLLRTAGLRTEADQQGQEVLSSLQDSSCQRAYNVSTKRIFWLSFTTGCAFLPLLAVDRLLQGWQLHAGVSEVSFSKLFPMNTQANGSVSYAMVLIVFATVFVTTRLFIGRSGPIVQSVFAWLVLLLIVWLVGAGFDPSCLGGCE